MIPSEDTRAIMSTHTNPNNIRDAVAVLIRYRWRFVLPAFLVTAGVLSIALLLPRRYQAEATFERRIDPILSEMNSRGASRVQSPRGMTTKEIVGDAAVETLITQLKADAAGKKDERRVAQAVNDFRHDLPKNVILRYDVSNNELDRVTISYLSTDPEMARRAVNRLVENYLTLTRAQMEARLTESVSFFEGEVGRERKIIEALENKLLEFEIIHAELLPDNPTNLQNALALTQERLSDLDQNHKKLLLQEAALRTTLAQTPKTTPLVTHGINPERERLEGELRKTGAELSHAVNVLKMKLRHPDIIALRERIAALEEQISTTASEVITERQVSDNPHHAELELRLAQVEAERQSLETQIALSGKRIESLNAQANELFPIRSDYRKITRELDQHQRQLGFWEDNLRRVRLAATAENGNRGIQLDFVKPCPVVEKPVSPNLTQVMLAAIGIGIMSGVASVFFAHRSDETFTTGEELAKALQTPLMGSVSEIISSHQRRMRRLRNLVIYPMNAAAMLAVLAILVGVLYLQLERPADLAKLRQAPGRFLFKQADTQPQLSPLAMSNRE